MKKKWAGVVVVSECDTHKDRVLIDTPSTKLWFVGVKNLDEGVSICRQLVEEEHVELIHLCGAWGYSGAVRVAQAVGKTARVGHTLHQAIDAPLYMKILEREQKKGILEKVYRRSLPDDINVSDQSAKASSEKMRGAGVFLSRGANAKEHSRKLETPNATLWIVGVSDYDQGVVACKRLVEEDGVEVIELFGEWGFEGAARIAEAVGNKVPIGVARFPLEESKQ